MKRTRKESTRRRHTRVRRRVKGTSERPRLAIFRSNQHIYAQVIDDTEHKTLAAASTLDKDAGVKSGANTEAAKSVGKMIAERAIAKDISQVVFDRGGNLYHGRVAALADAAREAGLQF
ncbi:MAG: 50S ribosomal protein L18 [Cyanobacteria bacterium P01_D01_bin.105]